MKIRPLGAKLFRADGRRDRQTDVTKPIVAFSNFCESAYERKIAPELMQILPPEFEEQLHSFITSAVCFSTKIFFFCLNRKQKMMPILDLRNGL
jgi:hypothetical protein